MTPDERTEALYQILDDAIAEIEEVTDLEGAAPYRAMASYILNRLPTMLCPLHLHDDLSRIAGMFEKASGDLQERSH